MFLLPQDSGYCQPILENLEAVFGSRKGLTNAATGTLNALLSPENVPALIPESPLTDFGGNSRSVQLELFTGSGRKREYRLLFKRRLACPTDFGTCDTSIDYCAPATPEENRWREYVLPDNFCQKDVWSYRANYDQLEKVCPADLAQDMAHSMAEAIENYAVSLNSELYRLISQPYAAFDNGSTVDPDPCVDSTLLGVGKGGWLDINSGFHPASEEIKFQMMNQAGAIFPFFPSNLSTLMAANNITQTPIAVHGHGALKHYVQMHSDGAYRCCSDEGVDQSALAQDLGFHFFLEGRPTANRNGVSQDEVLLWEPGAHQLIQPYLLGLPLQEINDDSHQRYEFIDSATGLQFCMIRNRTYCEDKVIDDYKLIHKWLLYSKPLDQNECVAGPVNQTLCINFCRCQPVDCDGNPTWGPQGDPTAAITPPVVTP